ncbi:HAMP domain-containing sensor histidine kinase [Paenibacillus sp. HB172176]|uniref:sensor histidine kinase n=1 Tax=Paenibacillus sp. HB172176 TaxID=2493690 RepID=UPI00143C6321|nr:HAMP domain-containing sensor histidine kinase [Paenibacillus sp. HB172176]
MTIRLRLTLWYSGLLAATLLVFGVSIYLFINWNTYNDVRNQLKEQTDNLGIVLTNFPNSFDINLDRQSQSQIDGKDMYVQLINYKEGLILQTSNLRQQSLLIPYPDAETKPQTEFKTVQLEINSKKYNMMTYQYAIPYKGQLVGLLQVGTLTYNEDKYLSGLRTTLIFFSIVVVLIAFTVGMFIARQALRPIGRVIQSTRLIEKGSDLRLRIPIERTNDEIGMLVNTLNSMLSRLETAYNELDEAFKAQRRFVSDASHELRTPLTTIRGNIDLLEKMWSKASEEGRDAPHAGELQLSSDHWTMSNEAMSDISAEAKRMSTLVGDLLALARADAGYTMEMTQQELLPLTQTVIRRAQLLPRTAEWKVGDLTALRNIWAFGNQDYLQQLLFIFIENAFKYTPDGYVEISAVRRDDYIGWRIQDTGIGMNPDEIPHIFDRFYRADESRGVTVGTGLGLSIAKWILDEHNGSVEVTTRENEGSTFTIWLPIDFSQREDSSIMEETNREEI